MIDPTTHCAISERSYHGATSRSPHQFKSTLGGGEAGGGGGRSHPPPARLQTPSQCPNHFLILKCWQVCYYYYYYYYYYY